MSAEKKHRAGNGHKVADKERQWEVAISPKASTTCVTATVSMLVSVFMLLHYQVSPISGTLWRGSMISQSNPWIPSSK